MSIKQVNVDNIPQFKVMFSDLDSIKDSFKNNHQSILTLNALIEDGDMVSFVIYKSLYKKYKLS